MRHDEVIANRRMQEQQNLEDLLNDLGPAPSARKEFASKTMSQFPKRAANNFDENSKKNPDVSDPDVEQEITKMMS